MEIIVLTTITLGIIAKLIEFKLEKSVTEENKWIDLEKTDEQLVYPARNIEAI